MGWSRRCSSSFAERVPLFTPHRPVCLAHAWALVEQSWQEGTPDASRAGPPAPWGRPPSHTGLNSALPAWRVTLSHSQGPSPQRGAGSVETSAQCPGRGQAPPPAPSPFLGTFVSLVGAGCRAPGGP